MHSPLTSALVAALLRLYPRSYRHRYGAEIRSFVEQEIASAGEGRTRASGVGFWVGLIWDHMVAARRVRRRIHGTGRGERMRENLRDGLRSLMRARGFSLFAVLTLGLALGATASVFTVLDRVVLRPFPWPGSERLVQVGTFIRGSEDLGVLSQPLMRDYLEQLESAEDIVGAQGGRSVLTGRGDPAQVLSLRVSPGYFEFFAGQPRVGRLFGSDDHTAGAEQVAVLSHAFWTEQFGADPGALGSTIELDGESRRIIGVLDAGFAAPRPTFWAEQGVIIPMGLYQRELTQGAFGVRAVARLAPGVELEAFTEQLTRIGRVIYDDPDGFVSGFGAQPLADMVVGEGVRRSLGRVLAAVAILLLIGCVNVASLLLTRASQRAEELRVRAALGATRGRILGQLLSESAVLALAGGVVGTGLAWAGVTLFQRYAPAGIPRIAEVALDPRLIGMTLAASLATVILFGLAPAWVASRRVELTPRGRGYSGTRRERSVRAGLVFVETALAVVLVVWSALLSRDLVAMATEDAGFRSEGLVAASINLRGRPDGASPELRVSFFDRLNRRAGEIPGVVRTATATELPYSGTAMVSTMTPEGTETSPDGEWVPTVAIGGAYFDALGIRFVEGRPFDTDLDDKRQLAVVNEAFVRRYWPTGGVIGRMIKSGAPDVDDEGTYEVVGVVADVRTAPGQEAPPKMYVDYVWESFASLQLILEVAGPGAGASTDATESVVASLRSTVAELDPGLPLANVVTFEAIERRALAQPAFYTTIFASFGLAALLLALVGVYGTTAYATSTRSREIGIRVALGESRSHIVGAILRRTIVVVGAGLVAGAIAAQAAAGLGGEALRLIDARDPLTYGVVAVLMLAAGVLAAWLPAHRLTRLDPAQTLRRDHP